MTTSGAAIAVEARTKAVLLMVFCLGAVAFLWPFVLAPGAFGNAETAPLLFGGLLVLVMAVALSEVASGGIDAKAVAMLGVLSAAGAALRPLGAGTAGIETVFFTLVIAGRVFGPGFGFVLGCTTLFTSALLTGGMGPWVPYQVLGCAWVGMFAGLLPPARGRKEVLLLALYGAFSAYLFGFVLNLSFWPFTIGAHSAISYVPGGPLATNLRRFLVFDATTSFGWDTGRAITNFVVILVAGRAMLSVFRRANRRAAFAAPVRFEGGPTEDGMDRTEVPDCRAGTGPTRG